MRAAVPVTVRSFLLRISKDLTLLCLLNVEAFGRKPHVTLINRVLIGGRFPNMPDQYSYESRIFVCRSSDCCVTAFQVLCDSGLEIIYLSVF